MAREGIPMAVAAHQTLSLCPSVPAACSCRGEREREGGREGGGEGGREGEREGGR